MAKPLGRPRTSPVKRFWVKVLKSDGCWLWVGNQDHRGYGRFRIDAQGKMDGAHRAAWFLTYGPVPDGLHVCHHCDNPRCVRPDHLFLGTHDDNMRDMTVKGRGHQGVRNVNAKVTEADVRAIRIRYAAGGVTQKALAEKYGVDHTTVSLIVRRKNWRHL